MNEKNSNQVSETELLAYMRYAKVAYNLQNSNRTQLTYKGATLTCIIATYIGIGYSPSSFEISLPFNSLLVVIAICIASLLVLGGIWYLDIIVEEKKIAKVVHNGLALEEKYDFLPRAYHNVAHMHFLLGYVSKKSFFYFSFFSMLILTICASLTEYFYIAGRILWWIVPSITLIVIPSLYFLSGWVTKKTDPYLHLDKIQHLEQVDYGDRKQ